MSFECEALIWFMVRVDVIVVVVIVCGLLVECAGLLNFMPLERIACLLGYCGFWVLGFVLISVAVVGVMVSWRGLTCFR